MIEESAAILQNLADENATGVPSFNHSIYLRKEDLPGDLSHRLDLEFDILEVKHLGKYLEELLV